MTCSKCGKPVDIPCGQFIREGVLMYSCGDCLTWFVTDGKVKD